MESNISELPLVQKTKINARKKAVASASSCCAPKDNVSVCCTPSETNVDNGGACCAQPSDGSACCDK